MPKRSSDGRCPTDAKINVPLLSNPMNPRSKEMVDGRGQEQAGLAID